MSNKRLSSSIYCHIQSYKLNVLYKTEKEYHLLWYTMFTNKTWLTLIYNVKNKIWLTLIYNVKNKTWLTLIYNVKNKTYLLYRCFFLVSSIWTQDLAANLTISALERMKFTLFSSVKLRNPLHISDAFSYKTALMLV